MTEAVVVALITGGFVLVGNIITVVLVNSKTLYRIDQLEEKVKEYADIVQKVIKLETKFDVLDERVHELEK